MLTLCIPATGKDSTNITVVMLTLCIPATGKDSTNITCSDVNPVFPATSGCKDSMNISQGLSTITVVC